MGKFTLQRTKTGWLTISGHCPACDTGFLASPEYGAASQCWLCPVKFRCESNSLRFSAADLSEPHVGTRGIDGSPGEGFRA